MSIPSSKTNLDVAPTLLLVLGGFPAIAQVLVGLCEIVSEAEEALEKRLDCEMALAEGD